MKSKQMIIDATQRCNWGFLTFTRILWVPSFKDELSLGIYLLQHREPAGMDHQILTTVQEETWLLLCGEIQVQPTLVPGETLQWPWAGPLCAGPLCAGPPCLLSSWLQREVTRLLWAPAGYHLVVGPPPTLQATVLRGSEILRVHKGWTCLTMRWYMKSPY